MLYMDAAEDGTRKRKGFIKRTVAKIIRRYIERVDPDIKRWFHPYRDVIVSFEDDGYDELYTKALKKTGSKPSIPSYDRYFNLFQVFGLTKDLPGAMIECGVWRGLGSLMLCERMKQWDASYTGKDYIMVDSFEGLSKPTEDDKLSDKVAGHFSTDMQIVKDNLEDFPDITFYKGWIPPVLEELQERKYKFVHIDVDLVEPTVGAFEYFYPRMVEGGVIVCDDYGFKYWPGTKEAVDEFCKKNNCKSFSLSTGELVVIK